MPNHPDQPLDGAKAATYESISLDPEDRREGTARQRQDNLAVVKRRKLKLVGDTAGSAPTFCDDGISRSKYSRKTRHAYRRLLRAVEDENLQVIVCWAVDRILRRNDELEDLFKLAAKVGTLWLVTASMDFNLNDSAHQLTLRMMVAMHGAESDATSRRVRRQREEARKAGRLLPGPCFGWKGNQPDPNTSKYLVKMVERLLAGESAMSIARWANAAKVPQVRGGTRWTAQNVRNAVSHPRHYGHYSTRKPGQPKADIIKRDNHRGIFPGAVYEQVQAVLAATSFGNGVPRRTSLLTGLVRCGRCGEVMLTNNAFGVRILQCKRRDTAPSACQRVRVDFCVAEGVITEATFQRVDNIDLARLVGAKSKGKDSPAAMSARLAVLDQQRKTARRLWREGKLTDAEWTDTLADIDDEEKQLRARLAALATRRALRPFAGQPGALAAAWGKLDVSVQREIITEALDVDRLHMIVVPEGRRNDPDRVRARKRPAAAARKPAARKPAAATPARRRAA